MSADYVFSFFIPCLNEEGNVGRSIDTVVSVLRDQKDSFEIIVVDDASTDKTVEELEAACKRYSDIDITIVRNRFCRGLGRNYFIAAHKARGEFYMLINGDAAEPAETIKAIVERRGDADAIVPYFGHKETRTIPRRILSGAFTFLVNLVSGNSLRYYNGPVLHRTKNVQDWFAETAGFAYQAELLCRLLDEGISVVEVQVTNSDRGRGASKAISLVNLLSVVNSLSHILLRRVSRVLFWPKRK